MTRSKCILAAVTCAAILSGCASEQAKNKTQREEAVQKWNQTRASVMYGLARDQFNGGELETAAKTADDALAMDPDSVPLRVLDARIAIERNRLDIADLQLAEARKRQPNNAEVSYYAGVVAQRWQKFDVALKEYTAANVAQPNELAYLMARAEMLVKLNRSDEALAALRDKVGYFETSAELRDAVGQLLVQAKRFGEAADMFRQASVLASNDQGIRERLGLACFQAGQSQDCVDVLSGLLAKPGYMDRADLFIVLGESQMQLNQTLSARDSFQRATELDPSMARGWLGMTKTALLFNDLRRADLAARKALSLEPRSPEAHVAAGYVKLKQNQLDEALSEFKAASQFAPNDAVSLCMIGYVLERQGNHDEALGYYGRALHVNPTDPLARKLMASAEVH